MDPVPLAQFSYRNVVNVRNRYSPHLYLCRFILPLSLGCWFFYSLFLLPACCQRAGSCLTRTNTSLAPCRGSPPPGWGRDPGGEQAAMAGDFSGTGGGAPHIKMCPGVGCAARVPGVGARSSSPAASRATGTAPCAISHFPASTPALRGVPAGVHQHPPLPLPIAGPSATVPRAPSRERGRRGDPVPGDTQSCELRLPQYPQSQGQGSHPAALARGQDLLLPWRLRLTLQFVIPDRNVSAAGSVL